MTQGIFITGTDTDIGKTFVSAGLVYLLASQAYKTGYFKPVLSGAREEGGKLIPGDTEFVTNIAGLNVDYEKLTPYIFKRPVSPHLAAQLESKLIDVEYIKKCFNSVKKEFDYLIVEGSGGLAVPLNEEGYMVVDLIKKLALDIIVVARAGLGTINHTIQTVEYARSKGLNVKGIIINKYHEDDLCERDNVLTLKKLNIAPILGMVPETEDIKKAFQENFEVQTILETFTEI